MDSFDNIVIDKNISIPNNKGWGFAAKVRGILEKLEVGDSFLINDPNTNIKYRSTIFVQARNLEIKIKSLSGSDNSIRFWRIE